MSMNINKQLNKGIMDTALKKTLKAKAHNLKPVVLLGAKGLTTAVIEESKLALFAHELIKIKMNGVEKDVKKLIANDLCEQLEAELVQLIGNTVILYKMRDKIN